jgi:CHAT domain-containing protein
VEKLASNLEQEKAQFKSYINHRENLTLNLAQQGRLVEAELEARETLKAAIKHTGKFSGATGEMLGTFGHILLLQGRLTDAEKISREVIKILKGLEFSENSFEMIAARKNLANNLAMQMNYTEAMRQFDFIKTNVAENPYLSKKFMESNPFIMLCLLKTGRTAEAMGAVSNAYRAYRNHFGEESSLTSEFLGLRGMIHAEMKADKPAMQDFSKSVPILLQNISSSNDNYLVKHLSGVIVDAYMNLLSKIYEENRYKKFMINPSSEIFMLSQVINYSVVQSALGASGARAAAVNPILADLVRKEQDALKQIDALHGTLSNAIAAPPDQQNPDALKDLKAAIDTLSNARVVLLDEIKKRFPKYADFTDPQPVELSAAQKLLHPGEALVVLYPGAARTYVWAIPYKGKIWFAVSPFNKSALQEIITFLREALDAHPKTFGDIPEFDLARAYRLYNNLLKPVENGWKAAGDLIIVAPGPLAQLPFSVLPTVPVSLGQEKYGLFDNYRRVPWLIRKVSITRQPSVLSFVTLRKLPEADPNRKALAAFGDPIFNRAQLALTEKRKDEHSLPPAGGKKRLHIRGIRITEEGNLDSTQILSSTLDSLNRLPDTAEEIKRIAETLGADPTKDIFLGKRASEKKVKSMDLANRRVIVFASHALVPGDIDGLDQPAIALSAPSVTGDNEDGLLTMGEVLKLRLNADWVILSACNTGAASGAGAESVSGLGSAFFYAGTRAILVSMWPVETSSARKLTTGLFRYQMEDKKLSRARAFRKSMLDLIDGPGLKDDAAGKIVASYAHPLFWAPFIMVGENGSNAN